MKFLCTIALTFSVMLTCCGCSTTARGPHRPAIVNHAVYIKLKNPADANEIIADGDRDLRMIPGVVEYYAGKRMETGRPGVDESFDVGFYLGFRTIEDYEAYLHHPAHVAAVEKWKPRWESIKICDVIDQSP
jgi:hypothetical protein